MTVYQDENSVIADYADKIKLFDSLEKLPITLYKQKLDTENVLDMILVTQEQLNSMAAFLEGMGAISKVG